MTQKRHIRELISSRFARSGLIVFFLWACLLSDAAVAQVRIVASIDTQKISIDDEASISLSVSGSMNVEDPVVPHVAGLDIVQTGRSSQFQMINGSINTSVEFSYTVVASDEGEFTIPPFSVFSKGIEYKSNTLRLSVGKGGFSSRPPPGGNNPFSQQSPYSPFPNAPGQPQTAPQRSFDHDQEGSPFWIATTVSKINPKVSEQILFRLKLYAAQTADIVDLGLPAFDDFLAEEIVHEKKGAEVIHGQRYSTYEVVYALSPLKTGKVTIGETKMRLRYYVNGMRGSDLFDRFFNDPTFNRGSKPKDKFLRAPAIDLNVGELPQPTPENFTGLIGSFGANSGLSTQSVAAGDSITYTVTISGRGNIKDAKLPTLELPNAKIYADKPAVETKKTENGVTGSKSFKMAIVPSQQGNFTIPARTLSFFDTESASYEELSLPEIPFTVTPATQTQNTNVVLPMQSTTGAPADSQTAFTDIAPFASDAEMVAGAPSWRVDGRLVWGLFFALPSLLVIFALSRRVSFAGNGARRGKKLQRTRLAKIDGVLKHGGAGEILESIRAYFSVFTDEGVGKTLTAQEIAAFCHSRGVGEAVVKKLRTVVESLEAAQYGFDRGTVGAELKASLKAVLRDVDIKMG